MTAAVVAQRGSRLAWAPWTDRKGRLHPLRAVVLTLLLLPGLWLGVRYALDMLGPRALNAAIHGTGYWAVWLLLTSLVISPARAVLGTPNLVVVRRMVGVAAAIYAGCHLLLYCADQNWRMLTVASEIVRRFYLTIGFVTLLGLLVLAVTSTDGWMRRLGQRWKKLHRIVYGLGVLAIVHYLLQVKADVSMPLLAAGLFFWLMMWRALPAGRDRGPMPLLGLTAAAALLTLVVEWSWYRFATNVDPARVLRAELDVSFGLRPVGVVLALGVLATAAVELRRLAQGRAGEQPLFWVVLFAAFGGGANALLSFIFGGSDFGDPDSLAWLWQDLTWAALLAPLGFLRWRVRDSGLRHLVDALALACIAYRTVLAADGVYGAEIVFAACIAATWAGLAWKTWPVSKLAAVTLPPAAVALGYGLVAYGQM